MSIPIYHLPLQDQVESGNKGVKMLTNSPDKPNTKVPMLTPIAEEQTTDKLGGLGAKDLPYSSITDHQDKNNPKPNSGDFPGGLRSPIPDNHTSHSNGHSLQSHKLMKREHDVSSDHIKMTSNPTKWKWLFLTLTEFDEDKEENSNEDNPNDPSYHVMDDDSDDKDNDDDLKYLGLEPGVKSMAESVDATCSHWWDFDSSWVKDTCKGLLKVLKIEPKGLTDQKRDCTAILMQILKQANIKNIFLMGSDAPEDLSFYNL